jgi:hypothetical protein
LEFEKKNQNLRNLENSKIKEETSEKQKNQIHQILEFGFRIKHGMTKQFPFIKIEI